MKRGLLALCFLISVGCSPPPKEPATSETHQWLLHFEQAYRRAWNEAPNDIARRMITSDYHRRLIAFISSKNYLLDSVRVKAGRPQAKGSSFFTEFKGPGILFHDEIDSPEEMAHTASWKEGRDTVLSFRCLGPAELAGAKEPYPVLIEATPLR